MIHASRTSSWTKSALGLHCTPARHSLKDSGGHGTLQAGALHLHCPRREPGAGAAHESHLPSQLGLRAFQKGPRGFAFPPPSFPSQRAADRAVHGEPQGCWKYSLGLSPGLAPGTLRQAARDHRRCRAAPPQAFCPFPGDTPSAERCCPAQLRGPGGRGCLRNLGAFAVLAECKPQD